MRYELRVMASQRGIRAFLLHGLAAFGLLNTILQPIAWAWSSGLSSAAYQSQRWRLLVTAILISLIWGLFKAIPPKRVKRQFSRPEIIINLKVGDLFEEPGNIVVGFSDTFDTDIANNLIINSRTMQGQLLVRRYGGDVNRLDSALDLALENSTYQTVATRKPGKKRRYPLGTVAVLEHSTSKIFAIAYSVMGDDLICRSDVHHIQGALDSLWQSVFIHGNRDPLAIGLVGSGFSRIDCFDRMDSARTILMSFVARSRQKKICDELTLVIHSADLEKVNMLELKAFLDSL